MDGQLACPHCKGTITIEEVTPMELSGPSHRLEPGEYLMRVGKQWFKVRN